MRILQQELNEVRLKLAATEVEKAQSDSALAQEKAGHASKKQTLQKARHLAIRFRAEKIDLVAENVELKVTLDTLKTDRSWQV